VVTIYGRVRYQVATTAIFGYLRAWVAGWVHWAKQKLLDYLLAQGQEIQQNEAEERAVRRGILLKIIQLLEEGEEEEALEEDPVIEVENENTDIQLGDWTLRNSADQWRALTPQQRDGFQRGLRQIQERSRGLQDHDLLQELER
jgi:hypothetical protein